MPPILVQPPADVAVVGVAAVGDILSGFFGAKHIHGIEIQIPRSSTFSPNKFVISRAISIALPGVSLVNAEARSYINHSPDPIRPRPDLADRYLGRNGGRWADADGEPAIYRGGMGRLFTGR